ncbi:MAG: hypothetical protein WBA12_04255 [Catalinimonas sp.]
MRIAVDISLYPFRENYAEEVLYFLEHLPRPAGVTVETNALSTHVVGDYDAVMDLLRDHVRPTFEAMPALFAIKITNAADL